MFLTPNDVESIYKALKDGFEQIASKAKNDDDDKGEKLITTF
jgi:hypothetical protein